MGSWVTRGVSWDLPLLSGCLTGSSLALHALLLQDSPPPPRLRHSRASQRWTEASTPVSQNKPFLPRVISQGFLSRRLKESLANTVSILLPGAWADLAKFLTFVCKSVCPQPAYMVLLCRREGRKRVASSVCESKSPQRISVEGQFFAVESN